MIEPLEQRILFNAVAPWNGQEASKVMGPFMPTATIIAAHSTGKGHVNQPPTITPVLPQWIIQKLPDPTDITVAVIPMGATLWGTDTNGMPRSSPVVASIRQGYRPWCWLDVAIEGMVLRDPMKLVSMLSQNSDGSFNYTMGNTIFQMTPNIDAWGAQFGPDLALFPMVLEKFLVERTTGNYAQANYGGWMSTADITFGWNVSGTVTPSTPADVATLITTTQAAGQNVTMGSMDIVDGADIVGQHGYLLVQAVNNNGTWSFLVYQPWGLEYQRWVSYSTLVADYYSSWVICS